MAIETKTKQMLYEHPDGLHTATQVTVEYANDARSRRTNQEADCLTDGAMRFITRRGGGNIWRCSHGDFCM